MTESGRNPLSCAAYQPCLPPAITFQALSTSTKVPNVLALVNSLAEESQSTMATQTKPRALCISLNEWPFVDNTFQELFDHIAEKATIQRVQEPEAVTQALSGNPKVVFLTDGTLTIREPRLLALWDAVIEYTRNGGTTICMSQFAWTVRPPNIKPFFSRAGLPWEYSSYHRTTVALNRENVPRYFLPALTPSYSQKAIFLKGVERRWSWYNPPEGSLTEHPFVVGVPVDSADTPAAMARVGRGWLGFVGEQNGESATHLVVLGMSGLYAPSV